MASLQDALNAVTPDPVTPFTLLWATVTAASPLRVQVDGEDAPLGITLVGNTGELLVGDRVRLASYGTSLEVLYPLGGPRSTGGGGTATSWAVRTAITLGDGKPKWAWVANAISGTAESAVTWVITKTVIATDERLKGIGSWTDKEAASLSADFVYPSESPLVGAQESEWAISADGSAIYQGTAPNGTNVTAPGWTITRTITDLTNPLVGTSTITTGTWSERE